LQFKRQKQAETEVNLTPLIDVVFLLLIFFMVSTSFIKETHLSINLPKALSGEEQAQGHARAPGAVAIGGVDVARPLDEPVHAQHEHAIGVDHLFGVVGHLLHGVLEGRQPAHATDSGRGLWG